MGIVECCCDAFRDVRSSQVVKNLSKRLRTTKMGTMRIEYESCLPRGHDLCIELYLGDVTEADEVDRLGVLMVQRHHRHEHESELARFLGDLRTNSSIGVICRGIVFAHVANEVWIGTGVVRSNQLGGTMMPNEALSRFSRWHTIGCTSHSDDDEV